MSQPYNLKAMHVSRFFRLVGVLLLVSSFALAGAAGDFLQAKQEALRLIIEKPKSSASDAELKAKFDALLDYETLAQSSLAEQWAKLSPEQQKEFTTLLQTLVQRAYTKSIRDTLDYNITVKGDVAATAGQLVQTVASHKTDKRKESIEIDYLLKKSGATFQVIDIITEGSSLVSNYRNQFKRVIAKTGFDGLMEKMRAKVASND